MKFHPEEYEKSKEYWKDRHFPGMSQEQRKAVAEKGNDLLKFHLRHPVIHHLISLSVFIIIFVCDYWVLLRLGAHIASPILAGVAIGILHSYIMYTFVVY